MNGFCGFLILFLVNFGVCKYFILGPATIEILKIDECSEDSLPITGNFSLRKYNKTQLITATFSLPFDMDETVGFSLRCSKWTQGGWMKNSYTIEDENACEALNKYVGGLWHDIESQIGILPSECPIKRGRYSGKNVYIDLTKMKIQMFLEGKFKTRIRFMKYSKAVFCKDFTLLLYPKN